MVIKIHFFCCKGFKRGRTCVFVGVLVDFLYHHYGSFGFVGRQKKPNQTHNLFIVLKNKLFVVVVAFIQLGRQQAHHIYICINIKKSKQVNRVGGENEPNNLKRMVGGEDKNDNNK